MSSNNKYDFKRRDSRSSGMFRPFKDLSSLLESKSFPIAPSSSVAEPLPQYIEVKSDHPEYEQRLFMAAMADVTPLSKGKYAETVFEDLKSNRSVYFDDDTESESVSRLRRLVENGEGFVVADTPEYIEGKRFCDNPEITGRLHRGDFSIQAYIDLHGLGVDAAQDVFDEFIKEAIITGKRAVLVIHGRGLSSPQKPVLKTKVQDWLTRGPLRKWVIAFASARPCDGGTGATYILLRGKPFTKRLRKKHQLRKNRRQK